VFDTKPVNVALVPVPDCVNPPGDEVIVQVPVDGNPLKTTVPVGDKQEGCVIAPITGAVGFDGIEFISALAEGTDEQPAAFVTMKE
jgi:hypothetical protein